MDRYKNTSLQKYCETLEPKIEIVANLLVDDLFGKRYTLSRTEFMNRMLRERSFSLLLDTALIRKKLEETQIQEEVKSSMTTTE